MRALELTLPSGAVRGVREGDVAHWRGIPYAAPPVGPRRWQAPQPVEPWTGVRECDRFGPICPQPPASPIGGQGLRGERSEDCLTLNITAPAEPTHHRLPVMVFLHGGAFVNGAGSVPAYDGSALARRGQVVYVSLNYRLGAWGWLHLDEYAGDGLAIDHNLGLRDMLAALRWVRECIGVFGGDPERVTVFGESAGAIALTALLACPRAEGLFAGAILQSAAPRVIPTLDQAHVWAREFLGYLGVDPEDRDTVRVRLREVDQEQLIAALRRLSRAGLRDEPSALPVVPAADGELLPRLPVPAIAEGRGLCVPVIIGTNDREGTLFSHFAVASTALRATWQQLVAKAHTFVDPGGDFDHADHGERPPTRVLKELYAGFPRRGALADLAGDGAFWYPSVELTEACSAHQPTWSYRFDYSPRMLSAMGVPATHGAELLPVFGAFDTELARWLLALGGRSGYAKLTASMQDQWLHFAHHQRPMPTWPEYDLDSRATMIFDTSNRIEHDPRRQRREAWEAVTRRPAG